MATGFAAQTPRTDPGTDRARDELASAQAWTEIELMRAVGFEGDRHAERDSRWDRARAEFDDILERNPQLRPIEA